MRQSEFQAKVKQASEIELDQLLQQQRENLYKMRQQIAMKQLDNPHAINEAKKNVARILTELRGRETKAGKES